MKNLKFILLLAILLSGCAAYKFQKGQPPFEKGYVVSYYGSPIVEYTVGEEDSVPADLAVAKARFKRRKGTVEYYYKKMGRLENRFKEVFLDPPLLFVQFVGGMLRLPFTAAKDYKFQHDPAYREKVLKIEDEEYNAEKARMQKLRDELDAYIAKDLAKEKPEEKSAPGKRLAKKAKLTEPQKIETSPLAVETPPAPVVEQTPVPEEPPREPPGEIPTGQKIETVPQQAPIIEVPLEVPTEQKIETSPLRAEPLVGKEIKAVIIAKPLKGFSPLKVKFSAGQSYSPFGRIVSYHWDFGDGDTSTKHSAVNTYLSATYGSRFYTVTLTVKDSKGNTAITTEAVEVFTK